MAGGWDRSGFDGNTAVYKDGELKQNTSYADILMSVLFWQALGKAEGWDDQEVWVKNNEGRLTDWRREWHRFIDHIIAGKDIDSFFKELLK